MSDCANLKAELAKLNSQVAGIGKRLSKLEDDVGKLKGNQGKVKQGGNDPPDLSAILARLARVENYINALHERDEKISVVFKSLANQFSNSFKTFDSILRAVLVVFQFVNYFRRIFVK